MSDTPDPIASRPRRKDSRREDSRREDSRREPATIDLSATEVRTEPGPEAPAPTQAEPFGPGTVPETGEAPAGAAEAIVRPTPDEVIPSDDERVSSPAPDPSLPPIDGAAGVAAAAPRRGPGLSSLLAAGVVGGLLGAGASLLAETWWRPPASGLDTRLAEMERRLSAQQGAPSPLEGRVARMEVDTKALAERLGTTQALAERTAKAVQEAASRPATTPAPAPAAPAQDTAGAAVLADLAARLGAVETQVQDRAQAAGAVQERVATVQERADAAAKAAQALERRLADHDQRLAALAKQFSERGPDAMAASLRVTLSDRLGDALREGAPVGPILAGLRRLEVKPEGLRAFEPYAQTPAPSAAALAQEFRPIGQRMIAETRPASEDWGERALRMLDKVVTIRAVGDPAAGDVASLVGRIEDGLARNAVGEAAAAWDALPEAARRIAPEWGQKLKQRAAAEAAARTVYSESLSALEASMR